MIGLATSGAGVRASWGVVLCVVAALAYSAAIVVQKPVLARVSGLQVTWLACTVGALVCFPFAPTLIREGSDASASAISWTIYLGGGANGDRLRRLGVCPRANERRPAGLDDVPRCPDRDLARLGATRRDTAVAGAPGRNPVPRRSRDCPAHLTVERFEGTRRRVASAGEEEAHAMSAMLFDRDEVDHLDDLPESPEG